MKILAVDDDEIILELLGSALDAHDFKDVELADCGENALAKIGAAVDPFDCFMFDIQMPGMDGIELCRRVRQLDSYASTPIIMITAMNHKDYIDRAFMAGATDYVTKPFDLTELITRVNLADRLQTETKRVTQASYTPIDVPKGKYNDALKIDEIEGMVTQTILHNYVGQMLLSRNQTIQAIAIKVPELELVFDNTDALEFSYVITDVADVIADVMLGYQTFISYFGSGVFVCVGPFGEMPEKRHIGQTLTRLLNDTDLVFCEDIKTSYSAVVGTYCVPKAFQKSGPQELFSSAIKKVENAGADGQIGRVLSYLGALNLKRSA